MSVSTQIDLDQRIILYEVTGEMTLDDVLGAVDTALTLPGFDPSMNSLWNLKKAHIAITMTELPKMLSALAGLVESRGKDYRVAILVDSNEDFGLSSIFEMNAYELPFEVQVFRNSSEARAWVTSSSQPTG